MSLITKEQTLEAMSYRVAASILQNVDMRDVDFSEDIENEEDREMLINFIYKVVCPMLVESTQEINGNLLMLDARFKAYTEDRALETPEEDDD